jgi:hypothetical protein
MLNLPMPPLSDHIDPLAATITEPIMCSRRTHRAGSGRSAERDDERADHRAADAADTSEETRATDDRRDRVKFGARAASEPNSFGQRD